jgi:hypothetical protein
VPSAAPSGWPLALERVCERLDFRVQDNPATRLAAVELAPRGDCAAQPPPPTDAHAYLSVACGSDFAPNGRRAQGCQSGIVTPPVRATVLAEIDRLNEPPVVW